MDTPLRDRIVERFAWRTDEFGQLQDLSGILADSDLLSELGPALADLHRASAPTVVVSPQAEGWVLGPLVATALGVGFVQAFKGLRGVDVADGVYLRTTPPDYLSRSLDLSVRRRSLKERDRVLLVDDWVETGGQADAIARIVADAGAEFVGVAALIDSSQSGTRKRLNVRSLVRGSELP